MRKQLRLGAVVSASVLVVATASGPLGAPAPAAAEEPEGWLVEAVRFEPLEPHPAGFEVDGLGAYRGSIELRSGPGGLAVVNDVGLEDYVRGIAEVPATWPAAALQAQAIAARTYALNLKARPVATPWREAGADVCPTQACQVYTGLSAEAREGADAWVAAVEATAGQVLLADGEPILAEYSSSNGGRSVPGSEPYLRAINDPDDGYSPQSRWQHAVGLDDLASLLGVADGHRLVDASRTGDAVVLTEQPGQGEAVETAVAVGDFVAAVQDHLGPVAGMSTPFPNWRFSVYSEDGSAIIDGRGWGHGRGMSQWGAYGKAQRGLEATDILAAYYDGIRPEPLPADQRETTIRVAIAMGHRGGAVTAARPFRVLDGSGTPLATVALGTWTVERDEGKLRVRPPEGFDRAVSVKSARVSPRRVVAGGQATVQFELSAPALVTVVVTGPGVEGEPASPPRLLEPGDARVRLPRARYEGQHEVRVQADAGPGRRAETTVRYRVQGQSVYGASDELPGGRRQAWAALACLLIVAVATAGVASRGREERPLLPGRR